MGRRVTEGELTWLKDSVVVELDQPQLRLVVLMGQVEVGGYEGHR